MKRVRKRAERVDRHRSVRHLDRDLRGLPGVPQVDEVPYPDLRLVESLPAKHLARLRREAAKMPLELGRVGALQVPPEGLDVLVLDSGGRAGRGR